MAKRKRVWTAKYKRYLAEIAERYTLDQVLRLFPKVQRRGRGRPSKGGKDASAEDDAEYAARVEPLIAKLKAAGVRAYVPAAIEQDFKEHAEKDARMPKIASLRRKLTAGRAAIKARS